MITKEQLKKIVPAISNKNLGAYLPLLNSVFEKYQINTVERKSCFIAQVAHESGSFKYVREIASGKAYEGRKDLGNVNQGDGVKFKGRGLIQATGRINYRTCSLFLFKDERLLEHPEILEQPEYAMDSACWYWLSRSLNSICDCPDSFRKVWRAGVYNKFQWLTIKINGGLNGYAERLGFYERAKKEL